MNHRKHLDIRPEPLMNNKLTTDTENLFRPSCFVGLKVVGKWEQIKIFTGITRKTEHHSPNGIFDKKMFSPSD